MAVTRSHLLDWTMLFSYSIVSLLCLLRSSVTQAYSFTDFVLQEENFLSINKTHTSSILGDPGMKSQKVRVAVEGWNFCNRAGPQTLQPSPRWADCTDQQCDDPSDVNHVETCTAVRRVKDADNQLQTANVFPTGSFMASDDPDLYAVEKEKYLASLCEGNNETKPWHFWMIMLKNGNFDATSGLCKSFASKSVKFTQNNRTESSVYGRNRKAAFPCFGVGCMNQPLVYHNWSTSTGSSFSSVGNITSASQGSLSGSFYGTYDMNTTEFSSGSSNISYFSVSWQKNATSGSWIFRHQLTVSPKYPWLMLYLRADTTKGVSGGYPWDTRGMMKQVPVSPNFTVVVTLDVIQGGGPQSQFYLIDIGGCWKNTGEPCNGSVDTDVTRYVEMIINPDTPNWCRSTALVQCPPYHISINGTKIYRNDTENFPYSAYHLYCTPPNAAYAEKPSYMCDPYSNPQAQELVQLLPHPEWAVHGYPAKKGDGWVGDSRTWVLDVGALSNRLYFYQDPETPPAKRVWPSIDVGTEVYISDSPQTAEWIVSDLDVVVQGMGPQEVSISAY